MPVVCSGGVGQKIKKEGNLEGLSRITQGPLNSGDRLRVPLQMAASEGNWDLIGTWRQVGGKRLAGSFSASRKAAGALAQHLDKINSGLGQGHEKTDRVEDRPPLLQRAFRL